MVVGLIDKNKNEEEEIFWKKDTVESESLVIEFVEFFLVPE